MRDSDPETRDHGRRRFLRTLGLGAVTVAAVEGMHRPAEAACVPPHPPPSECTKNGQPASVYSMRRYDAYWRIATANGIPNHVMGLFPNEDCPLPVSARTVDYWIPSTSWVSPRPLNGWLFGIAVSGVPFDPTGPFWNATPCNVSWYPWSIPSLRALPWQFEVMSPLVKPYLGLDGANAHSQLGGEYHYHGIPHPLVAKLGAALCAADSMPLIGWAADGYPIYANYGPEAGPGSMLRRMRPGYRLRTGPRPPGAPRGNHDGAFVQDYEFIPGLGDLDECNGRFTASPEFPGGTYAYFLTDEFPFVPRLWHGNPSSSFSHPLPPMNNSVTPPPLWSYRT